jgi:hypothetical protein
MARPHGDLIRSNTYVAGGEIRIGDFVSINSSGQVVAASASSALLGVALGYASASGAAIQIADHPDQEYLVVRDLVGGSQPSSQTDYMLNYDIVATAGTGMESAHKLDSSTGATTSSLPLRALMPGRSVIDVNECVVRINAHAEKAGVAGV